MSMVYANFDNPKKRHGKTRRPYGWVVLALVMALLLLALAPRASTTKPIQTPRPTLPAGTPTYGVFLPSVKVSPTTPTPTPRPTLEG